MRPLNITIDPEQAGGEASAPTPAQLARQAAKWFEDIRELRAWEDRHLFGEQPPGSLDRRMHRYQLSALMTEGEMLLLGMALNGGLTFLGHGVSLECIEANQRCLQLTFLDWHGEMPKERRRSLFDQLFHDPQPAT